MKHSVIIPLYNKEDYIGEALQSLIHQTRVPHEIIIIDDASTDSSLEQVRKTLNNHLDKLGDIRIEIIELKQNKGPGHARNKGITIAEGDLVSFLDADDTYAPHFLDKVYKLFKYQKLQFLVVGIRLQPNNRQYPNLKRIRKLLLNLDAETFLLMHPLKTLTSPDFIMGLSSNVVTRKEWLQHHRYDEETSLNEGIDFWYRIAKDVAEDLRNRIGLLMGDYIIGREVQHTLSRKKYANWREIDVPPTFKRLKRSTDIYDQLLMGVILGRWLKYSFRSIATLSHKFIFVYRYRGILLRQLGYYILRLATSN